MPTESLARAVAAALAAADPTPDADLLARYAADRDPAAFELLVHRHADLVWRVCRGVLAGDGHRAEDAFQATFLALARRAGAVRGPVGGYLFRVARHAALKARARAAQDPGPLPADVPARPAADPVVGAELTAVVTEEVARLPSWLRDPVVLCLVQGFTVAEAATRLDCPPRTVASRLSRARAKLRVRLERRGVAGAVAAATAGGSAPAALVRSTAAVGAGFPPSAAVTSLTNGALTAMTITNLNWAAAAAILGLTGGGTLWAVGAADAPKPAAKAPDPPKPAPTKGNESTVLKDQFGLFGRVLDETGKVPFEGVNVEVYTGYGTLSRAGQTTTDKDGQFRLVFAGKMSNGALLGTAIVYVRKPGWYGWGYGHPAQFTLVNERPQGFSWSPPPTTYLTPGGSTRRLEFRMAPAAAIEVRVIDGDGKPMANRPLWLTGDQLPPGTSAIASGKTDARGVFTAPEVRRCRFRLVLGDDKDFRRELVVGQVDFLDAAEYAATVTVRAWSPTQTDVGFQVVRGRDLSR